MSDEGQTLGGNAAADLKGRAEQYAGVLDEIDEAKERAKDIKDAAKSEGYDMKAFAQVVKEMRKGAKYQADQLQLELVLKTYRHGSGLPTDLAEAQKRAAAEAEAEPEAKSTKKEKRRRAGMN
ncbi:MAG: GapR family DNA-binding domain-containing protein [Hyphomicrobium sp.]|uniref:GapR family DNA-binding domain-containing protein n=1 Tax=Hyphomicrobium sp. TaxID=82 RepID=UPI003D1122B7